MSGSRSGDRGRGRRFDSRGLGRASRRVGRLAAFLFVAALGGLAALVFWPPEVAALRTTARSRAAVRRVQPGLVRDLAAAGLRFGAPIFVRIFKAEKELEVFVASESRFRLFRTYPICTYSGRLGPKIREGDHQAPEGFYFVHARRMNPASSFHLSFNLGYPNAFDRHHGRTGAFLMVHGNCVSVGCYAMTDAGIEQIYALAEAALRGGQGFFRVHAFPFRMTDANMKKHAASAHIGFWKNLKEGYDFFERGLRPPNVEVRHGRYVFEPPTKGD